MIDANGDSIFTCFWGQGSDTPDPDVKSVVETETITGGTGKKFVGFTLRGLTKRSSRERFYLDARDLKSACLCEQRPQTFE